MRTSLNEIKLIDQYLHGSLTNEDRVAVETRLENDEPFRINVFLQRKIHQLLALYDAKRLKDNVRRYHDETFQDPSRESYKNKILQLFK